MIFSSHVFLFYFLPLALLTYYALPHRFRHFALSLLSYVFYGWANPWFVLLMFGSNLFDYGVGLALAGRLGRRWREPVELLPRGTPRTGGQKLALFLSIAGNLAVLGFFKYFNFGVDSYNDLVRALGFADRTWDTAIKVLLPLGISFSVFQSMSYTIDVYRGESRALKNFTDFSYYVSMFPQMVAGPIVRFSDIDDQLFERSHTVDKFARGAAFFVLGFAKKVLLANPMGEAADAAFGAGDLVWIDAWMGVVAYAFQIYFDFSGYSDMAIGLGCMMGFRLGKNFDSPYCADSITNFWQRWHLSLSVWLRDYLYVPLGGNRAGAQRTYFNLLTVMLLGGLWHGASWNFVIWGAIHGMVLAAERAAGKSRIERALPRPLRIALTFVVVLVAWVFFRAPDLAASVRYLAAMAGAGGDSSASALVGATLYDRYHLLAFAACAFVVWGCRQSWDHAQEFGLAKAVAVAGLFAWCVGVLWTQTFNPFIYFFF